MNLRTLVSQILKEDAPIGGTQPAPQPSAKYYDVLTDFQSFEREMANQVSTTEKKFEELFKKNLLNKKVKVKAEKGGPGQTKDEYTIDVIGVSLIKQTDEYSLELKGKDSISYNVDPSTKIMLLGDSNASNPANKKGTDSNLPTNQTSNSSNPSNSTGPRRTTGIVSPQNMGLASTSPNTVSSR